MSEKHYRTSGKELRRFLRKNRGGGVVSDRISVDGCRVGYMERAKPVAGEDSGWMFTAGDEDDAYLRDPKKRAVFSLNCVANFDREVVPLLDATVGSAFARRTKGGPLERVQEGEPPRFPVVSGEYLMTDRWAVTLPGEFFRRFEDDSLVLWRPAHTIWTIVWGPGPNLSRTEQVRRLVETRSSESYELEVLETAERDEISYRLDTEKAEGMVHALYGYVVSDHGHVQIAQYLDIVEDLALARKILSSVCEAPVSDGG